MKIKPMVLALLSSLIIVSPVYTETTRTSDTGIDDAIDLSIARTLTIYSATDTEAIQPILNAFQTKYPNITVDYNEFESNELFDKLVTTNESDSARADVVLSSAMDLQIKLVNDGYAQTVNVPEALSMPVWSHWRNEAFGFTFEPAVIAYNKAAFSDYTPPTSHEDLANQLRAEPDRYRERVGTYDIRLSGVGYLLATQDAVVSSISGRLQESLGRAEARLYCCTSSILDDLAEGNLILGYNLLGSYALAKAREDDRIGIILPDDYTLVLSRVAFVSHNAKSPILAQYFIRFLLSLQGQQTIASNSSLIPLHPTVLDRSSFGNDRSSKQLKFHPIKVSAPLLTYLDDMKRQRFIREWDGTYGLEQH